MDKKLKIIGICGSPHINGNTAKLIKKILDGCKYAGAETEFISLGKKKISFCNACYQCIKKGECVLKDDLNEIRKKMIHADGLVIGSPVFNREVSAQTKAFFDRLFYDIHNQTFSKKYAVCVITYLITQVCALKTLCDLTMAMGYNIVKKHKVKLLRYNNEIEKDAETMKRAFNMGISLVENIKSQKRYLKQGLIRKFRIQPIFRKIDRVMEKKGLQ